MKIFGWHASQGKNFQRAGLRPPYCRQRQRELWHKCDFRIQESGQSCYGGLCSVTVTANAVELRLERP